MVNPYYVKRVARLAVKVLYHAHYVQYPDSMHAHPVSVRYCLSGMHESLRKAVQ